MYSIIKRKVYTLLDAREDGSKWHRIINGIIVTLIILNTFAVILETVEPLYKANKTLFDSLEICTIIIFSTEYLLRIWSCTSVEKYRHPVLGRLRYILSFDGIVDLVSILPFFLPYVTKYDLRFVRMLRLFRFFRFLKLGRYLKASKVITRAFAHKREELILCFLIICFLILSASIMMFYIEHEVQPDKFTSIPVTIWWSVATLTTVGYGDFNPITPLGKTLAAVISVLGVGMFALPAGIMASGFSEEFKHDREPKTCPYCGKEIED